MGKKVTIIETRERNPWGESIDESLVNDPGKSRLFIKGYSDRKAANELADARGEDFTPLAHRLQWVRTQGVDGKPDGKKVAEWKSKGYAMMSYDDAIKAGYRLDESAAIKGVNGEAVLGDLVLFAAPARVAAAHHRRIRNATKELSEGYEKAVDAAVEKANSVMGYAKGSHGATEATFEIDFPSRKK